MSTRVLDEKELGVLDVSMRIDLVYMGNCLVKSRTTRWKGRDEESSKNFQRAQRY
jgi:hypothetical protein